MNGGQHRRWFPTAWARRRRAVGIGITLVLLTCACQVTRSEPVEATRAALPPPAVTVIQATPPSTLPPATPLPEAGPPTATATENPYERLRIVSLSERSYGGGTISVQETLGQYDAFTRYLVSYPSDGLEIYGFLNRPHGQGPFPVVIALHGYIEPAEYETLDYTTRYADALARSGYLVIHPNLRGYPPSDSADNLFRVGMATDVLNLAEIVRQTAGEPGPLETASPDRIGLWGHSMGGGISLRVMTVDPEIDAAVVYAGMSGDEGQNFEKIFEWSGGERGLAELEVPGQFLAGISPINYLERIRAAVSIHHGEADELVPPAWSDDLCQRLGDLELDVSCYTYPGQPHTFWGQSDQLFIQRTIDFYDQTLHD